MALPEPSKPTNPARIVFAAIAMFLVVIGSFAAYFLWPRGQRLGAIDLLNAPSMDVELQPGDTLSFRLDVSVGTEHGYPNSSRGRSNAVDDELAKSIVTVTLARDGNPKGTTQCGAFDGKATTGSSSSSEVTTSGLPLRCSLVATEPGKHVLTADVAWVPKVMRKATLEVRRERPGE